METGETHEGDWGRGRTAALFSRETLTDGSTGGKEFSFHPLLSLICLFSQAEERNSDFTG